MTKKILVLHTGGTISMSADNDGKAHFDPVTHKILKPSDWEERFAPEPHIKRELDRQIQKSLQRNK